MTFDTLNFDVLSAARELRQMSEISAGAEYARSDVEKRAFELAEAILAQTCDEVILSPGGSSSFGFLLRYVSRPEPGPIHVVVDYKCVADVQEARGHWLDREIVLTPGRVIRASGLRLFGENLTESETFKAAMRDKTLPIAYREMAALADRGFGPLFPPGGHPPILASRNAFPPGSIPADRPTTVSGTSPIVACPSCGFDTVGFPCYRCGAEVP